MNKIEDLYNIRVDENSIESIFNFVALISLSTNKNWNESYRYIKSFLNYDPLDILYEKISNILNDINNYKLILNDKITNYTYNENYYRIIYSLSPKIKLHKDIIDNSMKIIQPSYFVFYKLYDDKNIESIILDYNSYNLIIILKPHLCLSNRMPINAF